MTHSSLDSLLFWMYVGKSRAKRDPTMRKTKSVPSATPYTEPSSTDSRSRVAVSSERIPTNHGKIVFADRTMVASTVAIIGLMIRERSPP